MQNGKKIFPEEIEEYLNKIDGVKESLVYEKNDENENLKINAKIVYDESKFKQKSQIEIKNIIMKDIKKLNELLPNYKRINDIIVTTDLLERTSTGKIKRQNEKEKIKQTKQINNENVDINKKDKKDKKDNLKKIKNIIENKLEIQEISEKSNIINDLGADSLDLVEIFLALEKEFNIKLTREDRKNIVTVRDILNILENQHKV